MTEAYKPTAEDRERMTFKPDMLKLSGDSSFMTFQGEGQSIGKPAVFLRLQACNLRCGWCDTGYAVFPEREDYWKEPVDLSFGDTSDLVRKTWQGAGEKRLVITGGEPMIQQKNIVKLIETLPDFQIEIETNGTIAPIPELAESAKDTSHQSAYRTYAPAPMVQFNVSPKLGNSDNELNRRFRPQALKALNALERTTFKFVVTGPEDVAEIQGIVDEAELDPKKVIVMPEGITTEALREHAALVDDLVKEKGWRLLTRMQIELYGQKRRT